MLKAGITGGIGSGKSTVCRVFSTLGIPVFDADSAARFLMENDAALVQAISSLLGSEVYKQGKLDRKLVAAMVFGSTLIRSPILRQQNTPMNGTFSNRLPIPLRKLHFSSRQARIKIWML